MNEKDKSSVSKLTIEELKQKILQSLSSVARSALDDKLSEILNPNNEKYEKLRIYLMNNIFDGITKFSWEYEDKLLNEVTILIDSLQLDNLIDSIKLELAEIYPGLTELELIEEAKYIVSSMKDDVAHEIKTYIAENTTLFAETMLIDGIGSFYLSPNLDTVKNDSIKSVENIIDKISNIFEYSLNIFTNLNVHGNLAVDRIFDKIVKLLDTKRLNFTNTVVTWTVGKMTNFIIKINNKIGEIFCPPRISLDEQGLHVNIGVDLGALKIGNTTLGNIANTVDRIANSTAILNANAATNRLKSTLNSDESKIPSSTNNTENDKKTTPVKTNSSDKNQDNKSNEQKKKETKENSVKDRKEIEKKIMEKDPDSTEPKAETYDNSVPTRATVKQDPRRNAQELVLWEGSGGGYVLLRAKCGSYLLLDESGTVRLQSSKGSAIQLGSNGDINIDSSANLRLNCSGASFIKQF